MQVIGIQKFSSKGQLRSIFLYSIRIQDVLRLFPCAQQDDIQPSSKQLTISMEQSLQNLRVPQLVKKFPRFFEPEASLPRSLVPAACPCPEANS
jgi:hypothetical protein